MTDALNNNVPSLSELATKALLKDQPKDQPTGFWGSIKNLFFKQPLQTPQPHKNWALMQGWDALKHPEGLLASRGIMMLIEQHILARKPLETDPDQFLQNHVNHLFQQLADMLHSTVKIAQVQSYAAIYQKLEDTALEKVWDRLSREIQLPNLTNLNAKKAWLDVIGHGGTRTPLAA